MEIICDLLNDCMLSIFLVLALPRILMSLWEGMIDIGTCVIKNKINEWKEKKKKKLEKHDRSPKQSV